MRIVPQQWVSDERQLMAFVVPLAVFGIALILALVLRHIALKLIRRRAAGPASFPAVLIDTLGVPSVLWSLPLRWSSP